uniref:Uncharacterized protein n=1 Tax=Arundo donax TaxID=35708 RepID=A0A0A9CGB8_ARUDO
MDVHGVMMSVVLFRYFFTLRLLGKSKGSDKVEVVGSCGFHLWERYGDDYIP